MCFSRNSSAKTVPYGTNGRRKTVDHAAQTDDLTHKSSGRWCTPSRYTGPRSRLRCPCSACPACSTRWPPARCRTCPAWRACMRTERQARGRGDTIESFVCLLAAYSTREGSSIRGRTHSLFVVEVTPNTAKQNTHHPPFFRSIMRSESFNRRRDETLPRFLLSFVRLVTSKEGGYVSTPF